MIKFVLYILQYYIISQHELLFSHQLFYRPGLRSIVTGYLPSVILSLFIYTVPFAMIAMARFAGYISRSRKDIKACNMVFYFLVGNVFLLSLLSGTLLDQIGKSFAHPKDIPSRLASAVTAQVSFIYLYLFLSFIYVLFRYFSPAFRLM